MKRLRDSAMLLSLISLIAVISSRQLSAQEAPLAWEATQNFQYNIDSILLDTATRQVKVIFSVLGPIGMPGTVTVGSQSFWDIKTSDPFLTTPPVPSRLGINIGWNTRDFVNTGSSGELLTPLTPQGKGKGAALPIQINALTNAVACTVADCPGIFIPTGRYFVTAFLPKQAVGTGRVAIEGHPKWSITVNGIPTIAAVPVKNVFRDFAITDSSVVSRRAVVDFAKCQKCHTGTMHDNVWIPRLSLHGANRTEELGVCVMCHNPNQTDIPYRASGKEESIDLKRFAHEIHAGEMRQTPLVIVGFQGTTTDFSNVRFPGELKNCMNCHVDVNNKGTFELPLRTNMGSTVKTGSVYATATTTGSVDVDPANDLKITPTAAVCSACHDRTEVTSHMVQQGGASFSTTQANIDSGSVREQCVRCHGPEGIKDVRKVHKDEYR